MALVPPRASGPGLDAYRAQLQDLFKGPAVPISPDSKTRGRWAARSTLKHAIHLVKAPAGSVVKNLAVAGARGPDRAGRVGGPSRSRRATSSIR